MELFTSATQVLDPGFSTPAMVMSVELPGVDHVVPDAIESAGYGSDGGKEGVTHPNGEHGVFLAEGLSGSHCGAIAGADGATYDKLPDTGHERSEE